MTKLGERGHAWAVFAEHYKGVQDLVRAVDLYTVHMVARVRGAKPDPELVERILKGDATSFFMLFNSYTADEWKKFEEEGTFRALCHQILVAVHAALEAFWQNKFYEYAKRQGDVPLRRVKNTTRSMRTLSRAEAAYMTYLDIDLTCFNCELHTTDGSKFQPKDCWDALDRLAKVRHQIAHGKTATAYTVVTPPDAVNYLEAVHRWAQLFDCNFDLLRYDGMTTRLMHDYLDARKKKAEGQD